MALVPVPIEQLRIPVVLDGSQGTNRATGNQPQIRAATDLEALQAWLLGFRESKATFDNYRKEAERLLLWATGVKHKPLSSLTHEDLLEYQDFLTDPQPAHIWIMPNGRKRPRTHPEWRPFSGPLAASSKRQAVIILNTMFSWLVQAGYLSGNPLALSRRRTKRAPARITRYLESDIWGELKTYIKNIPTPTARSAIQAARTRWLFSLLYLCGLRISEITTTTMGGFFQRHDRDGVTRWWLEVTGKGNKVRIIPASEELMAELARYRTACRLMPLPEPYESKPLVLPVTGKPKPLTRAAVHDIVKGVFKELAQQYRDRGGNDALRADMIEQASAHWLRHTAGSHMANGNLDLRHVRENLGHESLNTTSIYLHVEDDVRHQETEKRHRIEW